MEDSKYLIIHDYFKGIVLTLLWLLFVFIITGTVCIHSEHPTVAVFVTLGFALLYVCSIIFTLCTFAVSRISAIPVQMLTFGLPAKWPLFRLANTVFYGGILPVPDRAINNYYMMPRGRQWIISTVPELLMCGVTVLFLILRNHYAATPDVMALGCVPLYSVFALLHIGGIGLIIIDILLYFSKMADDEPARSNFAYICMTGISFFAIAFVTHNREMLKELIYIG